MRAGKSRRKTIPLQSRHPVCQYNALQFIRFLNHDPAGKTCHRARWQLNQRGEGYSPKIPHRNTPVRRRTWHINACSPSKTSKKRVATPTIVQAATNGSGQAACSALLSICQQCEADWQIMASHHLICIEKYKNSLVYWRFLTIIIYEHIFMYQNCNTMPTSILDELDEHSAAHVAELFRAFSDTSRVRIMSALLGGEKNVGVLAELVGISQSAVSHHMRGLRQMKLVVARREGKEVYYSIVDPHIVALFQQGIRHVREE